MKKRSNNRHRRAQVKRCRICVLPETFPGVKFNEKGVCNFCQNFKGSASLEEKKADYRKKFEELIKQFKGRGAYDVLMSYSGGKDSTYTLWILRKRYGLNPLAVTLDHGFLPEQTFKNIRNVAERLDFDHFFIKPYFLEEKHFERSYFFPYNISPLAFLDYDEEAIFRKVAQLGWKIPDRIDANTTKCPLNSFANITHKRKHHFHPYSFEMAKLVREGYLKGSIALKKLEEPEDSSTVELVKNKLSL